jgi:hypothetical protein
MPEKERRCEHPYREWDPEKGDFVNKPCPHPYFGLRKHPWTGEEINCCIFHAPMEEKKDHLGLFWFKFWRLFAQTKIRAEAAETKEEKKNVWLECFRFVFPDTGGRFIDREFPFSVSMWFAQFSGDALFSRARFSGNAVFVYAKFLGYADFWSARFLAAAGFEDVQFLGAAGFWNAKFSSYANFRGSKIIGCNFYGLEIRGFDFSGAKIGEFAQTAEYDESKNKERNDCKFQKIQTLKPIRSASFARVKYNAHNLYLKRVWDEAFYGAIWLFIRPVKWLLKIAQRRKLTFNRFPSRIYRRTKFYYVDTSAVDWSVNRQLERDIKYQQFLSQIWERGFVSKVFYFVWWLTSRCGESIWRWISVSVALVLLFACIYYYVPQMGYRTLITERDEATIFRDETETPLTVRNLQPEQPSFKTSLYFSVVTFTTLGFGDVTQTGDWGKLVVGIEVVLGYIMLGGLIAIFGNKFIRRE